MTIGIIIFIIIVLFYFIGKNKDKNKQRNSTVNTNNPELNSKSKITSTPFPNRDLVISMHLKMVDKALATGNVNQANLSYAKLIESIRQQNINNGGEFDQFLKEAREEYAQFRNKYDLEYPEQFLSPAERESKQSSKNKNFSSHNSIIDNEVFDYINSKGENGYQENLLWRKEYDINSQVPSNDFSKWIIEKLKVKDYSKLIDFLMLYYYGNNYTESDINKLNSELKQFLKKDFNSLFNKANPELVYEIQAYFIIKKGLSDFNREFWIGDDKEAEQICSFMSVYSFSVNVSAFSKTIEKINKFLKKRKTEESKEMIEFEMNEVEYGGYWTPHDFYSEKDLTIKDRALTNLDIELQKLGIGERLHFFDFVIKYNRDSYWDGKSFYKTRGFGINEKENINMFSKSPIFQVVKDINAIPDLMEKAELKEKAENAGFELKKSWTKQKIFENLAKTDEGEEFLKSLIVDKKILKFNETFRNDLSKIIDYQKEIRRAVNLITLS